MEATTSSAVKGFPLWNFHTLTQMDTSRTVGSITFQEVSQGRVQFVRCWDCSGPGCRTCVDKDGRKAYRMGIRGPGVDIADKGPPEDFRPRRRREQPLMQEERIEQSKPPP